MDATDKLNNMHCSNCGSRDGEYFFSNEKNPSPLCKDCLADILIDECQEIYEVQNLSDDDESDVEIINELWEQQKQYHEGDKNG